MSMTCFILFAAAEKNASLKLKNHVLEAVNYLIEDIKNCHDQIAERVVELVHQK